MRQNGQEKESLSSTEEHSQPSGGSSNSQDVACRYCDEKISSRAKICPHCQNPQIWWKVPPLELASPLGILIALCLLILGALQYRDAKAEKIEAKEALRQASVALKQASDASG